MIASINFSGSYNVNSTVDKFFIPKIYWETINFDKPFSLTICDGGETIVEYKCKFARGDDICFYSSDNFSYNSSNSEYKLSVLMTGQNGEFYLHVYGDDLDLLYEIVIYTP